MSMTRREQLTEHLRFFEELGVDGVSRDPGWRRRAAARPESAGSVMFGDAADALAADRATADTLDEIRSDLGECTRCILHEGRTTLVFGAAVAIRLALVCAAVNTVVMAAGQPMAGTAMAVGGVTGSPCQSAAG